MPPEREELEVDALFVGAGPASLAGAIHLARLIKKHNETADKKIDEPFIAVIEKGKEPGAHSLSGAVLDPRALTELMPDHLEKGCPIEGEVSKDDLHFLTGGGSFRLPFTPPPLKNHGCYIVSLGELVKWMAGVAEEEGIEIFSTFPGSEILEDDGRVIGVRTGDKGIDKEGNPKPNHQPGADFLTPVTVLGEGTRGSLTKQLIAKHPELTAGRNPQVYGLGVKELWKVPGGKIAPGQVIHTMGYPLKPDTYGGGFIYGMKDDMVSAGLVTGLDYLDPYLDPHALFQQWKTHPLLRGILGGGTMEAYGAKTMPLGGYYSVPKLSMAGVLLTGDTASLLNPMRLKGIHTAIKSGMLAAEAVFRSMLSGDASAEALSAYDDAVKGSWINGELHGSRNFHQGFDNGLWMGLFHSVMQMATGGRGLKDAMGAEPGHERMHTIDKHYGSMREDPNVHEFDGEYTFDKLTDVYKSGAEHLEDQPAHLKIIDRDICSSRCVKEYGNPCERFCPANVYIWEQAPGEERGEVRIDFANCVHCKTCDIMDPYQVIQWTTPEGGGGPDYQKL